MDKFEKFLLTIMVVILLLITNTYNIFHYFELGKGTCFFVP